MGCESILVPFKASRKVPGGPGANSCTTDNAQCTTGGILSFAANHTILAGATGATFLTPITPGVAGDHFILQPFGEARQRLHAIEVDGAAADVLVVSRGHFRHNGNRVGATMAGGFTDVVGPPGITMDCDRYLKCGISPTNGQCLDAYGANDALLVGWANSSGGDVTVIVTYQVENVG